MAVRRVDAGDEVLMVSSAGLAVRFSEEDARAMGRDTTGVRGMDVPDDVDVLAMDVARDDQYLLVVTENGFGKRTPVDEYRKTSRGAKGVKTIQQTEAKGALAGALVVREHHQLVFISQNGMVQRIAVRDIRPLGRNAQGFRLMNIREDDQRVRGRAGRWRRRPRRPPAPRRSTPRRSPAAGRRPRSRRTPTCSTRPARRTRRPGDDHAARGRRGRHRAVASARPRRSVLWRYQRKGVVRS